MGSSWGAAAGALAGFLFSAVNPYGSGLLHPLLLASQVAGMATAGAVGGILGPRLPEGRIARAAVVTAIGLGLTFWYDVLTNLATAVVVGQWRTTFLLAVPFAALHLATNAVLFASVGTVLVSALDRTRRSLAPVAAVLALVLSTTLGAEAVTAEAVAAPRAQAGEAPRPGAYLAQVAAPDSAPPPTPRDSTLVRPDSTLPRPRAIPEPRWGESGRGPVGLEVDDLAMAFTLEGGTSERFAGDRGSAELLGRFGIPTRTVLLTWLGLPVTTLGAVGPETPRVPWAAVAAFEAPRLPVSARRAFRGELGEVEIFTRPPARAHPRVTAWVATGDPSVQRTGFDAALAWRSLAAEVLVESGDVGPLEPVGPSGNHTLAARADYRLGDWRLEGAYRSARQALASREPRDERRRGGAGRLELSRIGEGLELRLEVERSDEFFAAESDLRGRIDRNGRADRGRIELGLGGEDSRPRLWVAGTYGRETLESKGTIEFARREAFLAWGAAGADLRLGRLRFEGAVGAGRYGREPEMVAPSILAEFDVGPRTRLWAGAGRGLNAEIDSRGPHPLTGEEPPGRPPVRMSRSWLGGAGLAHGDAPSDPHAQWPRGARRVRLAAYAGRTRPGFDPARWLLAGEAAENEIVEEREGTVEYAAVVANAGWSPMRGIILAAGADALGRRIPAILTPSDPEERGWVAIEGRAALFRGDLQASARVLGEFVGARLATPVGDLPSFTRLSVRGGLAIGDFDVAAEARNVAGGDRILPVPDPATGGALRAERYEFLLAARWTFWD